MIDFAEVDQTTFTTVGQDLPQPHLLVARPGDRLRRQRAHVVDAGGRASCARARPSRVAPGPDATVPGTTAFRWKAQPYAKAYDVEVYKNDDLSFSSANKVASGTGLLTTAYTWSKSLAPSASAYRWRVRRIDASGSAGAWSAGGRFFVSAGIPNITAPGSGAVQAPNGPVLEWEPLDGAATYTVTITPSAGGSAVIANTVSSAWAATAKFASGSYTWTLAAKDASGNTLGTATSTFTVNAALVADLQPAILSPDGTGVGRLCRSRRPPGRVASRT